MKHQLIIIATISILLLGCNQETKQPQTAEETTTVEAQ